MSLKFHTYLFQTCNFIHNVFEITFEPIECKSCLLENIYIHFRKIYWYSNGNSYWLLMSFVRKISCFYKVKKNFIHHLPCLSPQRIKLEWWFKKFAIKSMSENCGPTRTPRTCRPVLRYWRWLFFDF